MQHFSNGFDHGTAVSWNIPFWKCWVKAFFPKHSPQNVTLLNDYRKTKHMVINKIPACTSFLNYIFEDVRLINSEGLELCEPGPKKGLAGLGALSEEMCDDLKNKGRISGQLKKGLC